MYIVINKKLKLSDGLNKDRLNGSKMGIGKNGF